MDNSQDKNKAVAYRWQLPNTTQLSDEEHQLKILNSFTRKKELFLSNDKKTIKWYSCGPTVYDVAHLGHARCYITFDIIRRILTDYFGYQVFYVMNITDIDDKIIKRARSNYLCDRFIAKVLEDSVPLNEILSQLKQSLMNYQNRRSDVTDPDKLTMINSIVESSKGALKKLEENLNQEELKTSLDKLRDIIADEQDTILGHSITDHQIFKELSMRYEQEYHDDMHRLDVLQPSVLTRVSEYIEEVGVYLKKLESNGFAYRSPDGSVYFDTNKFDSDPKHSYAKLVREAFGHKKSLDEGEGELTCQENKKSPSDFALWKKSKSGEPYWETQDYESGRPGWHIECSVMASHLLGENFDIHSGGCDLKFPHHDNEIAQAEAFYNTGKNWVNYFIHSGHLTISGCKMSKSLKNFITIRQALQDYSSRQLRFAFLSHGWTETLDYSANTMTTAISYEKTFKEFFLTTTDTLRRQNRNNSNDQRQCIQFQKWSDDDRLLNDEFIKVVNKVDRALCDNFDTRSVLNALTSLIKECNRRTNINFILLKDIAYYIIRILGIFGTTFTEFRTDMISNSNLSQASGEAASSSGDAMKYVETLAQFRADIRRISKLGEPQQCVRQILELCDSLRDQTLPNLGVRLEDKEVEGSPYVVKLVDAETLLRERAMAEKLELEKKIKAEASKMEKLKLQQQREEKLKIPPHEMFKSQTDKYSLFDEKGLPTHDIEGKEISKSALKKLQRLYNEQETRYNKYVKDLSAQ